MSSKGIKITGLAWKLFYKKQLQQKAGGGEVLSALQHTPPSPLPSASHMAKALLFFPLTTNPNRRPLVSFSKREGPFQLMGTILQTGLNSPSSG